MDRETALRATADIGRASGLEAAAKVLLALADHKRRVVGTNEIKTTAASLQECAAELRAKGRAMNLETVLRATADIGRASGLEAAAKVLLALADHKRRVVGTNEIKTAAASLQECAAELREQ